jgi:hypothetical protein
LNARWNKAVSRSLAWLEQGCVRIVRLLIVYHENVITREGLRLLLGGLLTARTGAL